MVVERNIVKDVILKKIDNSVSLTETYSDLDGECKY